jgi:myo-inositol-1(or 4)-monophosphatase
MGSPGTDWLAFAQRCADRAASALGRLPHTADRSRQLGRGEGGDMTLAIDKAAEDAVFEELEALGEGVRVVSEERGEVEIAGGGPMRVVIDPIDGSLNAKRRVPLYSISIAVARGDTMGDVEFGFVADLSCGERWWATRGEGAWLDGERIDCGEPAGLEILGVESAHPRTVADGAPALAASGAHRLRMIGSIALSLTYVASARFDAMLSLRSSRSVDAAAGQLIVREAGGAVAFPDASADPLVASLSLDMRSRVLAAATSETLSGLTAAFG